MCSPSSRKKLLASSAFSANSNVRDADARKRGCFGIRDTFASCRIDTLSADDMSAARLPRDFGTSQ
jgi:hypothetical protein